MTRRVAPYTDAPRPQEWAAERRAAYRRTRGLAFALCVLVLAMLAVVVAVVAAAASSGDVVEYSPAPRGPVWAGIFVVGVVLGAFLRWMQQARDDRDRR